MKKILCVLFLLTSMVVNAGNVSDSLYQLAMKKFNSKEYSIAGELFEKSIKEGNSSAKTFLSAAACWANANNKDRTFANLFKMIEAGYINKSFIMDKYKDFTPYYDTEEWKKWSNIIDKKIDDFWKNVDSIQFPVLTKEQMYADYDSLIASIKQNSPHIRVREKECNMDYTKIFSEFRKEIEKYNSLEQFAILISRTLTICQDGHTSIVGQSPLNMFCNGESLENCAIANKYGKLFSSLFVLEDNLPDLIYINGNYFLGTEFKNGILTIPIKSKLIEVNGLTPTKYLYNSLDKCSFLGWDYNNKHFYSEDILQKDIIEDTVLSLTFVTDGQIVKTDVKLTTKNVNIKNSSVNKESQKRKKPVGFVDYWDELNILYIRIPQMSDKDLYVDEILKYKEDKIKKIIIDVRGNPGGSDWVWSSILAAISNDTIPVNIDFAMCKSSNEKYIPLKGKLQDLNLVYQTEQYNLVDKVPNSINYTGPVFVLYDENTFSAAGSLVNACYYSKQLQSVGVPTGRILGFGVNPSMFQLQNSHIMYRIESMLDVTGCKTYKDIFHDTPEKEVSLSLDEKINLRTNTYEIEFLKKEDPYIKTILLRN